MLLPRTIVITSLMCGLSLGAFAKDLATDLTTDRRIKVKIDRSEGDVRFKSTFLVAASPEACLSAALDFKAIDDESMVLTLIEPSVELGPSPPEASGRSP